MARSPTLYTVAVSDAYGQRLLGPFRSLATANARVTDEMSPRREGKRFAAVYREGRSEPVARYEIVPRMVLRTKTGDGAWREKVVDTAVENPARKRKKAPARPRSRR